MDLKNGNELKKPSSVLQGDGFYFNRILSRQNSVGKSSCIYYRRAEGVPFKWEMQPGTPKNRPEEEALPPLSPPPSVQSMGLPKPFIQPKQPDHSNGWFWRKIKIKVHKDKRVPNQISIGTDIVGHGLDQNDQIFQHGDRSDGDFVASFSCSSSSLLSYSSNSHAMESTSNRKESLERPIFCCSPSNISAILDEEDRKVYYCRIHNTAFAVENDGSLVGSRILPKISSVDQSFRSYYRSSEGIPFKWEMQPGTPKHAPENELIPPPSPPPALQSLGLQLPKLNNSEEDSVKINKGSKKMSRMFWFWISKKIQRTEKVGEFSLRQDDIDATEDSCYSDDQKSQWSDCDSVPRSSSASSIVVSKSKSLIKLSKLRRDFLGGQYFCFNPRKL